MLAAFVEICQKIGAYEYYVQGGGGNISLKVDAQTMIIKASGGLLRDVSLKQGFSIVNYPQIIQVLCEGDQETIEAKNIQDFVIGTYQRPSMELGFHALLDTCVIHTHSVYANLLTCSIEGPDLAKKLFPSCVWIPYSTPGWPLSYAIARQGKKSSVLFLENHGLIVCAKDSQTALDLHEEVNAKICDFFDLKAHSYDDFSKTVAAQVMNAHILFPDQVIYTLCDTPLKHTQAGQETLKAYSFIMHNIADLGLTLQTLKPQEAKILLNLESEKYRQKKVH